MAKSWVDFKRAGTLREVLSNKELRSYLYFSKANPAALLKRPREGRHGRQLGGYGDKQSAVGWDVDCRGDQDKGGYAVCYMSALSLPNLLAPWGSYCHCNFFHGTPKPKEIPNGSVY